MIPDDFVWFQIISCSNYRQTNGVFLLKSGGGDCWIVHFLFRWVHCVQWNSSNETLRMKFIDNANCPVLLEFHWTIRWTLFYSFGIQLPVSDWHPIGGLAICLESNWWYPIDANQLVASSTILIEDSSSCSTSIAVCLQISVCVYRIQSVYKLRCLLPTIDRVQSTQSNGLN